MHWYPTQTQSVPHLGNWNLVSLSDHKESGKRKSVKRSGEPKNNNLYYFKRLKEGKRLRWVVSVAPSVSESKINKEHFIILSASTQTS